MKMPSIIANTVIDPATLDFMNVTGTRWSN